MATELLMTQEGYDALKAELNELKSVTRGEISEKKKKRKKAAGAYLFFRFRVSYRREGAGPCEKWFMV